MLTQVTAMTKSVFFEIVVSEHRNYATIKSTGNRVDFPRKLDLEETWHTQEWFRLKEKWMYENSPRLYLSKDKAQFWIEAVEESFICPDALQERFTALCAIEYALFDHINFLLTPKF